MFDSTERYSFFGHPVPEALAARLADRLHLRDNRDGRLVQRLRTELRMSVPPARTRIDRGAA